MTHGDLIPGNVLVTDGRLAGGYYVDSNSSMSLMGRRTLERVVAAC
jgi:hypothetical protein